MGELRAGLLALLLVCSTAAARADEAPERALERLLAERSLRGAQIGLLVADLESGRTLLAREAHRPMVPASNQKLLIAAAALLHWGPAHRFETRIASESAPDANGVLAGPLWVIGSGDPSLVSESLWKLAEELRLRGVRELRSGIAIDSSYFDSIHTHRDWEPLSSRAYHSRVSAFAANYSSFRIDVNPALRSGRRALVSVAPEVPYLRVQVEAPTVRARGLVRVELETLPDASGELVQVTGAVAIGSDTKTLWRSVAMPERYAAAILIAQLKSHGVRVRGPTRFGSAPSDMEELVLFQGESVAQIVHKLNKFSNNFIAEQLVKLLGAELNGAPGGWKSGTRAVRTVLEKHGLIEAGTVIADGSGLSPRNRVSPATLVRVIVASASAFDSGPEFLASLPISGRDGTLEDRMEERPVSLRGKTGHLRHVSSLSGLLAAEEGRRLAFSLIVNGGSGSPDDVDLAMDQFVAELAVAHWGEPEISAQGANGD